MIGNLKGWLQKSKNHQKDTFTTDWQPHNLMEKKRFLHSIWPALSVSLIMILVKLAEVVSQESWALWGLKPRVMLRLPAIISFPFLHADWLHLFSNLLPFFLFSILIYNLYRSHFWKIWVFTFGLSGYFTWCFARPGIVIGASAWVYALFGFLMLTSFLKVNRQALIIGGGIAFLYGSMVYGLVPVKPDISWEGHLMGLLSGLLAAVYWKNELKGPERDALKKPFAEGIQNPTYPYWLYDGPPVLNQNKELIHPDDLIWENGVPRLKPKEPELENAPEDVNKNGSEIMVTYPLKLPTWHYTSSLQGAKREGGKS